MIQYIKLLEQIQLKGVQRQDRTGTGTQALFGEQLKFDLSEGFPLVTTKKVYTRAIIHELLWFLKGDTNIKYLQDNDVKIWNEWGYKAYLEAHEKPEHYNDDGTPFTMEQYNEMIVKDNEFAKLYGDLGPVYGKQWRSWETKDGKVIDQISNVIEQIKTNPDSRRLIVTAWRPDEIEDMKLPPCHCLFQFNVMDGKLNCQLFQRSADIFLGVPFNIASYALLTMMIANVCGLEYGVFTHTFGDVHIYDNHKSQVKKQIKNAKPFGTGYFGCHKLPQMHINPRVNNIFDFEYEDFKLVGYKSHGTIKAPVAV